MNTAIPIDTWPIVRASGIDAAWQFTQDDMRINHQYGDESEGMQSAIPAACVAFWRLIAEPFGLNHLVLSQNDWSYLISGHGNLAFRGPPSLNLGLLFPSLADLPFRRPPPLSDTPDLGSSGHHDVVWKILARVVRSESLRRLQFEIGDQVVVLHAKAAAFEIVSGATDPQAFVDLVRAASGTGQAVRYTLGDPPPDAQCTLGISDLLGALGGQLAQGTDRWLVSASDWPEVYPATLTFSELQAVLQSASGPVQQLSGRSPVKIRGYDNARTVVLEGQIGADKTLRLSSKS